jgi:fructokinase
VDTIGAGDIYDAGFITALMRGKDYAAALQWGNAVAAYAISKEGARTSPTFEQMNDFINQKKQERK